jgi:queuine tRNA-ribosyltransferase
MEFVIEKVLPNGLGRVGVIKTAHGEIKTPAFMAVGTRGYVRFISADDLHELGAQAMLSNGYHLRRQAAKIAKAGGLAEWKPLSFDQPFPFTEPAASRPVVTGETCFGRSPLVAKSSLERESLLKAHELRPDGLPAKSWQGPTLTDSGGFQVMSLGSGLGKVVSMEKERHVTNTAHKERLAHVSEDGVSFTDPFDGEPDFIGPEESMQIQCQIGADIHMAFDELTSLADTYEYNIEAMQRTERWAERSLREHLKHRDGLGYRQNLYGILQGGRWEDLRRQTAQNLAKMRVDGAGFDGFGLGGAFLKEDLGEILRWCNEELPIEKPRHLLGLSHPDDILIGAEMGADTFDCVAPMREARHGKIYTRNGNINLRKFADTGETLDQSCDCTTCKAGWTRGSLRAMWRSGDAEKKAKYYNLASIHNLRFIVRLTEEIRKAMLGDYFDEYRREFLAKYYTEA